MRVALAALLATTALPALAYTAEDARYVAPAGDEKQLAYVVCLERQMRSPGQNLQAALSRAAKTCRKSAPRNAADLRASILECGFKKGDASPDAGCGD